LIKNKRFIATGLLLFMVFIWGCSSSFSFSWNTEKEVDNKRQSEPPSKTNEAVAFSTANTEFRVKPASESVRNRRALYGVQITRLGHKTPEALRNFMEKLRENEVDTIFFRVFQNRGDAFFPILPRHAREGVYFKTTYAPLVSDLLPLVCRIAHREGLQVYAWMNTLNASFLYCKSARHIFRLELAKKRLVHTNRLSPFDPEVRRCLSGLFSDLAKYPIDGILVQDDLILHYNEDFNPIATGAFKNEMHLKNFSPLDLYEIEKSASGKVILKGYSRLFWTWCSWKNRRLSGFAGKIFRAVRKIRPSIKIATDVNYEALLYPEKALAWYSRSIQAMEKFARPDTYVVMSYQKQMQRELKEPEPIILDYLKEMVKEAIASIPDPDRWVFKVQTIGWRTHKPIDLNQIRWALSSIRSTAPVHTCLMPFTPFLLKNGLLARLNPSKN